MDRTFAIGDIHGDLPALQRLMGRLPALGPDDTLVFLGDYVDRGPQSKQTVEFVRHELPQQTEALIVTLMGNHEDGWLRHARGGGWAEFATPRPNGCLECVRSYLGTAAPVDGGRPDAEEYKALLLGTALPEDVLDWMAALLPWYEDEHAIYVHGALTQKDGQWLHPNELSDHRPLMWQRSEAFFRGYEGKRVVCGHTPVTTLPTLFPDYTPEDPTGVYLHKGVVDIDTGCGRDGFLSAIELPTGRVYDSR